MRLLFTILLLSAISFGQDRNGISYQALILNPTGESLPGKDNDYTPLANTDICLKFYIINSSGNYEYSELQTVKTDVYGMVNLIIGTGQPVGAVTWDAVAWSSEAKSLKVDLDITGVCASFTELSNQQLTSVPFALYSPSSNVPGPKGDPGDPGADGDSAYQVWLEAGNTGSEQDFLDSLKGTDGEPGDPGADGDSAYQLWIDEGNTGTEQEFLDSLKGTDGDPGEGTEGKSAYEVWIELGNTGTEQDFIDSLVGPIGEPGEAGLLSNGDAVGNTTFWNGTEWVTTSNNLYNDGTNVMIGTSTAEPSSALTVASTSQGILLPKMTLAQRDAIANPASGLLIFQTDNTPGFYYHDGTQWINIASGNNNQGNITISVNSQDLNNTLIYTSDGF